jgi:hypothetical protein
MLNSDPSTLATANEETNAYEIYAVSMATNKMAKKSVFFSTLQKVFDGWEVILRYFVCQQEQKIEYFSTCV